MSEITKTYRKVLDELHEGGEWRDAEGRSHTDRLSDAGIAVTVAALREGRSGVRWLTPHLPDFTPSEINEAVGNLVNGGGLNRRGNNTYVNADESDLDDGLWWVLQGTVACGFIEKVAAEA